MKPVYLILAKLIINQIRARYPQANITPVDYDPSATRVNQENSIKLMPVSYTHLDVYKRQQ